MNADNSMTEYLQASAIFPYILNAKQLADVSTLSRFYPYSAGGRHLFLDPCRINLRQQYVDRIKILAPAPAPLFAFHQDVASCMPDHERLFSRINSRLIFARKQEEQKPQHSYIGLIAQAILSSSEGKMVLSDIYQHILENYSYFRQRGPGWRNSIRHNLSLNDCFVKAERSANGKGHYWAIHPANLQDFKKGDFRRRKAQRKVRRHLGISAPEEDDSRSSPPLSPRLPSHSTKSAGSQGTSRNCDQRKRPFDVASLLAPDSPNPGSEMCQGRRGVKCSKVLSEDSAVLEKLLQECENVFPEETRKGSVPDP